MNLRKFLIALIPIFLFNGCVVIHDGYVRHYGDNTVERYYYNDNVSHYKRYPYKHNDNKHYYKTPNRYDNRYDNRYNYNKPYNKYNNPNYYYNKHHNNNNYHNNHYYR